MQVNIATFADFVPTVSGHLTIVGARNAFPSPGFPVTFGQTFFVAALEFEPLECGSNKALRLELSDQDGKIVYSAGPLAVPPPSMLGNRGYANAVLQIINLPFPAAGSYTASLWHGDDIVKSINVAALVDPNVQAQRLGPPAGN